MQVHGSCRCGLVSFTAEVEPSRVMVCHCSDCQTLSGAPFRAVVASPYSTLTVSGQTKSYVKVAESGNRRAQVFCPECATPLWATSPENPTSVVIRVGCLHERAALRPAVQIWTQSAQPWLEHLTSLSGSPKQHAFLPVVPSAA